MTDEELRDALDGLHAYDEGAADSGIRDEGLRARCIAALAERRARGQDFWRPWLARLARDMYLSDEKISQGSGLADLTGFAEWLEWEMKCPV